MRQPEKRNFPFERRREQAIKEDRITEEKHAAAKQLAIATRQVRVAVCLNWVTGAAALFALASVIGLIATIRDGRIATEQQNRAWIGLDGPIEVDEFRSSAPWGIALHYSVRNFGHGPALKVTSSPFIVTDPKHEEQTAKFMCDAQEAFSTGSVPMAPTNVNPGPLGHILFPDQTAIIGDPIDPDKPFVWKGPGTIADGQWVIAIGCAAYMDQFQRSHWTRFCMQGRVAHGQLGQWDLCNLYNDTDETGRTQSKLFPLHRQ